MRAADLSSNRQKALTIQLTKKRISSTVDALFVGDEKGSQAFWRRFEQQAPNLVGLMVELYGDHFDLSSHIDELLTIAAKAIASRPYKLRAKDARNESEGAWFRDHQQVGGVAYVDRFAGNLKAIEEKLGHLEDLGLTYLHLMPLFARPEGPNDGGYAVSSYRDVDTGLGSMSDLARLADAMHMRGMALCVDFILNHTADNHPWAVAAKSDDAEFRDFYFMFEDRQLPDAYAQNLRPIFPDRGGDAFVWRKDVIHPNGGMHVWSTFYPYQWDLNYRNPAVFTAIAGEMLFLANQGVDVLRLDAVPFLWKQLGTACENLPEAHLVVRALNTIAAIAAPSLVFKSEAIVHPDKVASYIDPAECQLSYNPLLMVSIWEAIATRDNRLLMDCLTNRHRTAAGTAWINYLRGHDDIGWGFANEDCLRLGIDADGHRAFLNAFYTGRHTGSFAIGLPFQENPQTGDCRICGTLASLAGLESADNSNDDGLIDLAIQRVLAMHAIIMTAGGIPLLYLGDEIAQLNDWDFQDEPAHADDNRWVHRPLYNWHALANTQQDPTSPAGRVLWGIKRLIALRQAERALSGNELIALNVGQAHLIAYRRQEHDQYISIIVNLSEHAVSVAPTELKKVIGSTRCRELWQDGIVDPADGETVSPYGILWLRPLSQD